MKKQLTLFAAFIFAIITANAQQQIYVSTQGDDTADGTVTAPVRSLSHALTLADENGSYIRIASGNYTENQTLELRSNLTIEGGLDAETWQEDGNATVIFINSVEFVSDYSQKIGFRSVNDTSWTLKRLNVSVAAATTADRATSGKGATVYGLFIEGNAGNNRIEDCNFTVGDGGDGISGVNGTNGANGGSGSNGGDGGLSEWTNDGDDEGIGASAVGTGSRAGGKGGNGGEGSITHSEGGYNGISGAAGGNGNGGHGGNGGAAGAAGHNGSAGADGVNGADGISGAANNTYTWAEYFIPANTGDNGTDGLGGGGAGGGGGGGGATNYILGIPGQYCGGAGGGGGAGGEAGTCGTAGTSGGGCFGIYCFETETPAISNTNINIGRAGQGGAGGQGGIGGQGGNGGSGGSCSSTGTAGKGGNGGHGGKGGNGGNGENGQDGAAQRIAFVNNNQLANYDISHAITTSFYFCSNDDIVVTAQPGFNGETCRWYESETSTTVLATTSAFRPNLSSDTVFYVASYNQTENIESIERVPIFIEYHEAFYDELHVSICEGQVPYVWNGHSFYTSGNHTIATPTEAGCDSIMILYLTVNAIFNTGDRMSICENELPYEWNGAVFTEAGVQTVTLQSAGGCDSIVTLRLDVYPAYNIELFDTICESELPYIWNGLSFTESGTQTFSSPIAGSCDSTVTLTLTVNPSYRSEDTIIVGGSQFPYTWNGIVFSEPGTSTINLQTVEGCDSIITLHVMLPESISEQQNNSIAIFPNPFSNTLTITANGIAQDDLVITIYDVFGKLILRENTQNTTTSLNLSELTSGMYIVRISQNGQIIRQQKVIKR